MTAEIVGLGETLGLISVAGIGRPAPRAQARVDFGGAETNTLVAAARLGVRSAWLGAVGRDAVGEMVVEGLRGQGVDVSQVIRHEHAPTAVMFKYRRTATAVHVDYLRACSAFSSLREDDVSTAGVREAGVLHTTGITVGLGAGPLAVVRSAISAARATGTLVSFDVNHRRKVWRDRDPTPVLREIAAGADIVFASLAEASLLVDGPADDPIAAANAVASMGPTWVVIKEGAQGLTALADGSTYKCAARRVEVHEAVGAGDALAAGVLVGRLRGMCARNALELGVDLGTYAVTVDGEHENAPTWEELDAFRSADEETNR